MEMSPLLAAQCLVGRICWACYWGEGLGGLTLRFGEKIPKRISPSADINDLGQFTGEYNLWVTTGWRLHWQNRVVATSSDPPINPREVPMSGLRGLVGKRPVRVEVAPPAWDLVLEFEDGYSLMVFSNRSEAEDEPVAWRVYAPGRTMVIVGPHGQWTSNSKQSRETMWRRSGQSPPH